MTNSNILRRHAPLPGSQIREKQSSIFLYFSHSDRLSPQIIAKPNDFFNNILKMKSNKQPKKINMFLRTACCPELLLREGDDRTLEVK